MDRHSAPGTMFLRFVHTEALFSNTQPSIQNALGRRRTDAPGIPRRRTRAFSHIRESRRIASTRFRAAPSRVLTT